MSTLESVAGELLVIDSTVRTFALLLVLSTLLERLTEVVSAVYHFLDGRFDWNRYWSLRARRLGGRLHRRLRQSRYLGPEQVAGLLNRFRHYLLETGTEYPGTTPVVSGDLVRAVATKIAFKTIAIMLGVVTALLLDINVVGFFQTAQGGVAPIPDWLGEVATGVAAGLGTAVVHKVISAIERRRETIKERRNG